MGSNPTLSAERINPCRVYFFLRSAGWAPTLSAERKVSAKSPDFAGAILALDLLKNGCERTRFYALVGHTSMLATPEIAQFQLGDLTFKCSTFILVLLCNWQGQHHRPEGWPERGLQQGLSKK